MNRKVLLILADGMRADALEACGGSRCGGRPRRLRSVVGMAESSACV